MKQLPLDIGLYKALTFDNFIVGQNSEAFMHLQQVARGHTRDNFIYIWGEPGSGKSHLLRALATDGAHYLAHNSPLSQFEIIPGTFLYALDDCHLLSAQAQIAAFDLYNQVREHEGALVISGNAPPQVLQVREDLRTRLGWGLIYQLHMLSDEEKLTTLQNTAQARGLKISSDVLPYLMSHFERDLDSLFAWLDALDRFSLQTQRPITLPLLRELRDYLNTEESVCAVSEE